MNECICKACITAPTLIIHYDDDVYSLNKYVVSKRSNKDSQLYNINAIKLCVITICVRCRLS